MILGVCMRENDSMLSELPDDAKDLANKIFEVVPILEVSEGLALMAKNHRGFENWLKVEISGKLWHYGKVMPEANHIDILFDDKWAIELKDRKTSGENVLTDLEELNEKP